MSSSGSQNILNAAGHHYIICLKWMPLACSDIASHSTLPSVAISHALPWLWATYLLKRPLGQYYFVYIYNVYKEIRLNLIPGI
jgi:hypothetical protein